MLKAVLAVITANNQLEESEVRQKKPKIESADVDSRWS